MHPEESKEVIAVRLHQADVDWLENQAALEDVTRSDVIRGAIAHYVDHLEQIRLVKRLAGGETTGQTLVEIFAEADNDE